MSKSGIFQNTPQKSPLQNSFFNVNRNQVQPQKVKNFYRFTFENMPKVNCLYHMDQYITMFCRNPSCNLPLCPQCIKLHSQEHQSYGTYGEFDTLENCLTETYQKVSTYCNSFADEINNIQKSFQAETLQQQLDKVKQARAQCHQMIDSFFNTLENELSQELDQNRQFMIQQTTNFSKYLQQRWKTLMGFLEKLNTDKCIKNLVKFYQTDFERENQEYFHETNQFNKQLIRCTPEIIIDQSQLYQINVDLARYVSLKQVPQAKSNYIHQKQTVYPAQNLIPITFDQLQNLPPPQENSKIHPYLLTPTKNQ
ncbi:hypothetical protein pb186bvf_015498 [Paramecium bursaria]